MIRTTEEFIERAKAVHGERYDYSATRYTTSKGAVEIICKLHGSFLQTANNHTGAKAGCPWCGGTRQLSTQDFIAQARAVHGDVYDYSAVVYKSAVLKVAIGCKKHGPFEMIPDAHKRGQGCPACKFEKIGNLKRGTLDKFLARALEVHGDTYDYSLVTEYITDKHKVSVICKHHGAFLVSPNNHQRGRGCPLCKKSGYRVNKPANFYILTSDDVTKVGITNRDPNFRVKEVSKSAGKKFEIVFTLHDEDGMKILRLEQQALAFLRDNCKVVEEEHDGSTESFTGVDLSALKEKIELLTTNRKAHNV